MKKILQLLTLATLLATSLSAAPIHDAAKKGDIKEVQRLLDEDPNCVNARAWCRETPLHEVAPYGYTNIVRLLLERGADVNARTSTGMTPLHYVAVALIARMETARLLLECGADLNAKDTWGRTPLAAALVAHAHSLQIAQFLSRWPHYPKILWNAVCKNNLKVAKLALVRGASPNAIALESMFPITNETPEDVITYLRALIERQDTLMHVAVKNGNAEMVKLLLAFGGKTNIQNQEGKTALDLVFEREGFLTILPLILEVTVKHPQTEHGQKVIQQLREQAEAAKAPQCCPVYSRREDLEEFANSLGSVNDSTQSQNR